MHVTAKSGRVFRVPSAAEDARIRAGIAADPDACEPSDAALKTLRPVGRPVGSAKTQITLRVDNDTLATFKATGQGWQTRMNDALREWVQTHGATAGG